MVGFTRARLIYMQYKHPENAFKNSKLSDARDSLRDIPSATKSLILMTFFSISRRKFGKPDCIVVFTVGQVGYRTTLHPSDYAIAFGPISIKVAKKLPTPFQ